MFQRRGIHKAVNPVLLQIPDVTDVNNMFVSIQNFLHNYKLNQSE